MYGLLGWKSKANPNHVFVVDRPSDKHWMQSNPHAFLTGWAQWNDTMGDGWTAHTPNTLVTADRINDYLSGLLEVLIGERESIGNKAEALALIVRDMPQDVDARRVEFLKGMVCKGDGAHYHKRENKTSKAATCKHDDRWLLIPEWAGRTGDNDPATIYGLMHNGGPSSDWGLRRAVEWQRIRFHAGTWGEFPKFYGAGATEATGDLIGALWALVESERQRDHARRCLEVATNNLAREAEKAAG